MLNNIEIKTNQIVLHFDSANEVNEFSKRECHRGEYHLTALPEHRRTMGVTSQAETLTLTLPESSVPKLPDSTLSSPTGFFYEDIKDLADKLMQVGFISTEQRVSIMAEARTTLEADHTLFYPSKDSPLITVDTRLGHFRLYVNEQHPDFDQNKVDAAKEQVTQGEVHTNVTTGPAYIGLQDYPGHFETLENLANVLVRNDLLESEQKQKFIEEIRSDRIRHFAALELKNAGANVRQGAWYSDGNGGSKHQQYTLGDVQDSIPYLRIMKALADTGDFRQLEPEDLKLMLAISYKDDQNDKIKKILANALLYETVPINGRDQYFGNMCAGYRIEIEAALAQRQLIDSNEPPTAIGGGLATKDLLPKDLASLAEVLTVRDKKTGECLLDQWTKAGGYERIKEAVAPLAQASSNVTCPNGQEQQDVVLDYLKYGTRHSNDRQKTRGILQSLGADHKAVKAVFDGLAAGGPSVVLREMKSHVRHHHNELLDVIVPKMKLSWVKTNQQDDGSFPGFKLRDIAAKANFGETVYQLNPTKQEQIDYLKGKDFSITEDRSEMTKGTAFLDTQYANTDNNNLGTLYVYKHDLERFLGAKPSEPYIVSIAGSEAPQCLSSGF